MNLLDKALISMSYFATTTAKKTSTSNGSDPTASGVSLLKKWTEYSKEFGWAIAGICVIIVGIMFFIPSDEQHRNAKKFGVAILIGAAIICAGPAIVESIKNGA